MTKLIVAFHNFANVPKKGFKETVLEFNTQNLRALSNPKGF
jgi:hypothetical protein